MIRNLFRALGGALGLDIRRISADERQVSLRPRGSARGDVLVSYTINPFLGQGMPIDTRHTADWECLQIVKTFLDLGYAVDVINYDNHRFLPRKPYAFLVDELTNLERLSALVPPTCVKIFHGVFAHWLVNNRAAYDRYMALRERRGILLRPRRLLAPNLSAEQADALTVKGNDNTVGTYRHAGRPVYRIAGSSTIELPWPDGKDFDACRRRFVWFGGRGLVHKGLDLVLEAFAQMPAFHLTVCGPVQTERDFETAFAEELYRTPNIRTVGWVDLQSTEFVEIADSCVGVIYPSCAEACAGSVINCMHAGLIPVVSRESGVEVRADFGLLLRDCSVTDIQETVQALSSRATGELTALARHTWEFARATYTRQRFVESYREAIAAIIAGSDGNRDPAGESLARPVHGQSTTAGGRPLSGTQLSR